jgi:type I restriction enzyme S subunit
VPKGWEVTKLGSVIELAYGKALKECDRIPGDVPVFGSKGITGWHNKPLNTGPGVIVGRKGNAGAVTWSHTAFFAIDTTFYVRPLIRVPMTYLFHELLLRQDLENISGDSAVPGLNRDAAYRNECLVPPSLMLEAFSALVAKWFTQIHHNLEESRALAAMRDTLLPKLLSGEVRVKDVAEFACSG